MMRRGTTLRRALSVCGLLAIVVVVPLVVTMSREGSVVVRFGHGHGLHSLDLATMLVAVVLGALLVYDLRGGGS